MAGSREREPGMLGLSVMLGWTGRMVRRGVGFVADGLPRFEDGEAKVMGLAARKVKFSGPGDAVGVAAFGDLAREKVMFGEAVRSG